MLFAYAMFSGVYLLTPNSSFITAHTVFDFWRQSPVLLPEGPRVVCNDTQNKTWGVTPRATLVDPMSPASPFTEMGNGDQLGDWTRPLAHAWGEGIWVAEASDPQFMPSLVATPHPRATSTRPRRLPEEVAQCRYPGKKLLWGLCILCPLDFSSTACLADFSVALGPPSLPLGVLSFLPPNPFLLPSFLPSLGSWVPTWRSGQSDGETGSGQGFVLGHRSDYGAVDTAGGQPAGAGSGHSG